MQSNLKFIQKSQLPKHRKIRLVFVLLAVNNDTIQIMTRMNHYQNRNKLQIKNKNDENNLATNEGLYLQLDKIIDHFPDSAEVKGRWIIHRCFGKVNQKDVIHFPTYNVNLCVLCYCLLHSGVYIVRMGVSSSKRYKRSKIH